MHALGVGHPKNVLACFDLGYDLFDSAMPTRDARHGRLYALQPTCARSSSRVKRRLAFVCLYR